MDCQEPVSIYYLASGRLGIPVLDALVGESRVRLLGVGSQPDRPAGRKRRLVPTALAQHALDIGLPVSRVSSVNNVSWLAELAARSPELVVVASFGQLLKPALLELPRSGCLNVHASLLPRHRGASPVAAALLAGDSRAGISFMAMDRGLDTGPVYTAVALDVAPGETAEELELRLGLLAARHIGDVIWAVAREGLRAKPQATEGVTYAARLSKEDGELDWRRSASCLERQIRAYMPWPRSFTSIPGSKGARRIQVTMAQLADPGPCSAVPGTVVKAGSDGLVVACGQGFLRLVDIIPEGRSQMPVSAFLRGTPIAAGTHLGRQGDQSEIN